MALDSDTRMVSLFLLRWFLEKVECFTLSWCEPFAYMIFLRKIGPHSSSQPSPHNVVNVCVCVYEIDLEMTPLHGPLVPSAAANEAPRLNRLLL